MADKKITRWNFERCFRNMYDVLHYLEAAIQENDTDIIVDACKDVIEIARKKGWIK